MATMKKPAAKEPALKKTATPAKKPAAKKAAKSAVKRTPNAGFMKPMTPSTMLAAVVGAMPLPRTEVVKKIWEYIRKNKLQDAINKRMINADEKLREIFGKAQVSMFEMTKIINQHLKQTPQVSPSRSRTPPDVSPRRQLWMQKEVNIMASNAKEYVVMQRSIEFVLEMPNAQKVILMGDFNQWDPKTNPMCMDKNGVWRETVMIIPGRYEYRFWVDGEWYNDPRNSRRCPNCFGSENNVIEVM